MNITKNEKTGKVTGVKELVATNGNNLWQLVVNTAEKVDINNLASVTNLTSFALSQNERTEFSVLMPHIEGVKTEDFAKVVDGKDIDICVFKVTIKDLSDGKVERITYTTKEGVNRVTSTMSRTYIKGSQNADENVAFEAMRDELLTKLNNGEFEVFKEETATQQQQKSPKFTF